MANAIRWLVEAFNPCIHQWATVATLKDREENPTVVRMVQECVICGEARQKDFATPEPPRMCHHRWVTEGRSPVFTEQGDKWPKFYRYHQACEKCGEVRKVDLT